MATQQHILIIDDDAEDQEIFTECFRMIDQTAGLRYATNGKEALALLRESDASALPTLILLDYKMPILTGPELLQILSTDARYNGVTKIVWSTSDNEEYRATSLALGAAHYFVKPFDTHELTEMAKFIHALYKASLA